MSDFKLNPAYTATADQPKAIDGLAEGLDARERFQTLLGATGTGKTFTMAGLIELNQGAIFKITTAGAVTVLYSFTGSPDGDVPTAGLVLATDGNFYGMTDEGGADGQGTIFKMTPAGVVTVLHSFAGGASDGARPQDSRLIQAADGNFYGTTIIGGPSDRGTVFQMTPAGAVTILYSFTGGPADGAYPRGTVIQAATAICTESPMEAVHSTAARCSRSHWPASAQSCTRSLARTGSPNRWSRAKV